MGMASGRVMTVNRTLVSGGTQKLMDMEFTLGRRAAEIDMKVNGNKDSSMAKGQTCLATVTLTVAPMSMASQMVKGSIPGQMNQPI